MSAETALAQFRAGKIDAALEAAELGLRLSAKGSNEYWKFQFVRADCLRTRGQGKQALEALDSSEDAEVLSLEVRALQRIYRAYLLGLQNCYAESIAEFKAAEEIAASAVSSTPVLVELYLRRGMILFFAGDYGGSENNYRTALTVCEQGKDRFSQAVACAGIGKNSMIRKDYRRAMDWFGEALRIATEIEAWLLAATMKSEVGWCALNLHEGEKALNLFREAEGVFREAGAVPNYQICLGNIGNVYLREGDYDAAISYYRRALELARKIEDQISTAKWLHNLALVYSRMGNPVAAASYYTQAKLVKDRIEGQRKRLPVA